MLKAPVVVLSSILFFGCSAGNGSSPVSFSGEVAHVDFATTAARVEALSATADFQAVAAGFAKMSWKDLGGAAWSPEKNGGTTIGGWRFTGTQGSTKDQQIRFTALHARYPTLGAYWREIGLDAQKQIKASEFKGGLAIMAKLQAAAASPKRGKSSATNPLGINPDLLLKADDEVLIQKVLLATLAAGLTASYPAAEGGSFGLSGNVQPPGAGIQRNSNVVCNMQNGVVCANGNNLDIRIPDNMRPLFQQAAASTAPPSYQFGNNNVYCNDPICIIGPRGLGSTNTVSSSVAQAAGASPAPTTGAPLSQNSSLNPCAGLPRGSQCWDNLICGKDTKICINGNDNNVRFASEAGSTPAPTPAPAP